MKREKQMKGPADYVDKRKPKVEGQYHNNRDRIELWYDTQYLSKHNPAASAYKPNHDSKSQSTRASNANLNRDKSPKATIQKIKRDDSPSPTTYKDVDHTWMKTSPFRSTFNYTIKKEKKSSFIDEMQAAKKKLPQCGHY